MAKRLSATSRKLLKNLPTPNEMYEIIANLRKAGDDATVVILGAAYIENSLEALLEASFRPLDPEDRTRMFDGAQGGILGPLSAKIRMAYAIKRIGEAAYHDFLLINDIRNVFAHSLHRVTFSNEFVAADCARLIRPNVTTEGSHADPLDIAFKESDTPQNTYCTAVLRLILQLQLFVSRTYDPAIPELDIIALEAVHSAPPPSPDK